MAWFAWQSVFFILGAFVLGILVGYWLWRIQWRRVAFTESEAVTVISRRHERALGEKDAEISRLQALVAGGTVGAAAVGGAVAATQPDRPAAEPVEAQVAAVRTHGPIETSEPGDDATVVTRPALGTPVVPDAAAHLDADADLDAQLAALAASDAGQDAGVDAQIAALAESAAAASDAAEPRSLIEVPESEPVDETVVDVTDDAVIEGGTDGSAAAVAQLPTQPAGEDQSVIDLAALETGADADAAAEPAAGQDIAAGAAGGTAAGLLATDLGEPAGRSEADTDGDRSEDTEDDLERIEGIGPRIASALRTAGIRSFRRLADADVPSLQAALEAAGLRFAPSLPTWSRQARFLADGDEVGFIKLTESLVAGREPGRSR